MHPVHTYEKKKIWNKIGENCREKSFHNLRGDSLNLQYGKLTFTSLLTMISSPLEIIIKNSLF